MNVTFGLRDYGRMQFMLKMAELLKIKKKLEIKMGQSELDKGLFLKKIEHTQKQALGLLD